MEEKKLENLRHIELKSKDKKPRKSIDNKLSYNSQKKLKSLKNKLSKVESSIDNLESEIKDLDHQLELDYDSLTKNVQFFNDYHFKKENLNELMSKWEDIQNEINNISD